MNRIVLIVLTIFLSAVLASAADVPDKPTIAGPVLNGASFDGFVPSDSTPMPIGTGLAGGSMFVIFGSKLGPVEIVLGAVPYPNQLPAEAGGTRVTFRSLENDQVYTAPLIHSLQYQVSGIVPSPLPVGLAEVTVSYDGMESEPTKVAIVEFSPGLFTVSQTGTGPAVVQNYESALSQPLNTLTQPAAPGQYVILWGTGLGAIDGPDNAAPPAGNVREDVSVRIGDVEIPAEYAGRSPEFPGLDQINVRIPDDGSIELGCYQDLGIQIGNHGFGTQASISISDKPGECDHPWGLPAEKLAELDSGGTVTFLEATLSEEFSVVKAATLDAYGVSRNRPRLLIYAAISPWVPLPGSCLPAKTFQAPLPLPTPSDPSGRFRRQPGETALDMGDSVQFAGPGARAFSLPKSEYDPIAFGPVADVGDALAPGEWTLTTGGGGDLKAFSSPFSVAGLPTLLGRATVPLGVGMEITWDGAAYQEGDRLLISLRLNPEEFPPTGVRSLRCNGAATRGSVEITVEQLAWLQAQPGSSLLYEMTVESAPQAIEAEGLDYGRLTVSISQAVELTAVQ